MGLLKWTKAEIWCDFPGCHNNISFEGNDLRLFDWIRIKGWLSIRGFYFCVLHKDDYLSYIQDILSNNKERIKKAS